MRIDVYLTQNQWTPSRASAQDAIKEGRVSVNGQIIKKASYEVKENDQVQLQMAQYSFASRAGLKLFHALNDFQIDLANKVVLDVGASSGGFSDVCLQQHALKVYAVDVGHDQLIPSLKNHPQLVNRENTNALDLRKEDFNEKIQFMCMDVSFVSIKSLLPHLLSITDEDCEYVVLIKPQFEAGKKDIGKNGIVKDEKVHVRVLNEIIAFLQSLHCGILHLKASEIAGRDGNQEYLIHFNKKENQKVFHTIQIVKDAKKNKSK